LASNSATTSFGTFKVQVPTPATTYTDTINFSNGQPPTNPYNGQTGAWSGAGGSLTGTSAAGGSAIATRAVPVAANSDVSLQADIKNGTAGANGGLVFDYLSA